MSVKLVSVTQPLIDGLNSAEDLIVYCARVSNPENQLNTETGERLLRYCMKHGHWSVFEQADMTLEIVTSRAISAQIIRHKSFAFQEFSQRYSEVTRIEPIELRKAAEKNRQSSNEIVCDPDLDDSLQTLACYSQLVYQRLLLNGIAKECARMVLPLATSTTLCMKGSVRSWIHYFKQRLSEHTQKEHRLIAKAAFEIFKQQFPVIAGCLEVQK